MRNTDGNTATRITTTSWTVFASAIGDPASVAPVNGYPAFILSRKIQSDGVETKLTLAPG